MICGWKSSCATTPPRARRPAASAASLKEDFAIRVRSAKDSIDSLYSNLDKLQMAGEEFHEHRLSMWDVDNLSRSSHGAAEMDRQSFRYLVWIPDENSLWLSGEYPLGDIKGVDDAEDFASNRKVARPAVSLKVHEQLLSQAFGMKKVLDGPYYMAIPRTQNPHKWFTHVMGFPDPHSQGGSVQ